MNPETSNNEKPSPPLHGRSQERELLVEAERAMREGLPQRCLGGR